MLSFGHGEVGERSRPCFSSRDQVHVFLYMGWPSFLLLAFHSAVATHVLDRLLQAGDCMTLFARTASMKALPAGLGTRSASK